VLDKSATRIKADLVRELGATFHTGTLSDVPGTFDVVMECTGAASLPVDVVTRTAPDGIVCLAGVSEPGNARPVDIGALNRDIVLGDRVIFGTVNANRRHYEAGMRALVAADREWLGRLITRRVPLAKWRDAFTHSQDDVKTVIDFGDDAGVSRDSDRTA
jgi:threonine dehydrogenase-like Zn-dependent dehydrogenase